ncbi:MAG: hypothetical protein UZ14_CFX002002689 [Chloroflexi bacterium OLB14]|nr:MAG: hypothetical protein UZ14_CFX002002689 [Chloroflexi bacterium OLB14]
MNVISICGGREGVKICANEKYLVALINKTMLAMMMNVKIFFLLSLSVAVMCQEKIVMMSVSVGIQKSKPRMGKAGCSQKIVKMLAMNKNQSLPRLRMANNKTKKTIIKI